MSESFETNINKLFCYFYQMTKIKEISLIFDIPSIMNKVSNYEMIILKFIINIFLLIKSRNTFRNITIISDNLNFDNRKHPFLSEFLENMDLFNTKESLIDLNAFFIFVNFTFKFIFLNSYITKITATVEEIISNIGINITLKSNKKMMNPNPYANPFAPQPPGMFNSPPPYQNQYYSPVQNNPYNQQYPAQYQAPPQNNFYQQALYIKQTKMF